jgi:hypothetical protein
MSAAGGTQLSPLHSGLHFVPPPYVPFRSLSAPSLGYSRKSASFIPLHSGQPAVSFRSPLSFPPHIPELKAKTGSCISPNPIRSIAFCHHTCFSQPNQRYVLRSVCPGKQKPQIPHSPLMVAGKNKGHSRMVFVLAAGSSHSFNRSL